MIRFRPAAARELTADVRYYNKHYTGRGDRFAAAVERALFAIVEAPGGFPLLYEPDSPASAKLGAAEGSTLAAGSGPQRRGSSVILHTTRAGEAPRGRASEPGLGHRIPHILWPEPEGEVVTTS